MTTKKPSLEELKTLFDGRDLSTRPDCKGGLVVESLRLSTSKRSVRWKVEPPPDHWYKNTSEISRWLKAGVASLEDAACLADALRSHLKDI